MKLRSATRVRAGAAAALAAGLLAGCGEIKNTITPQPGTTNQVTVALAGQPNAFYIGLYEAQALGYFKQTDMNVRLVVPTASQDPVSMVHDRQALIGISSEPNVLLHRNENEPVVGVAALVHAPLPAITIREPRAGSSGGAGLTTTTTRTRRRRTPTTRTTTRAQTTTTPTTTTPTTTTTTVAEPDSTIWPGRLQQLLSQPGHPTYAGLVVVVRKETIVEHAGLIRRFVQAVARGYRAARANPSRALADLINRVPALAPQAPLQHALLRAAMPAFFPAGLKVWGYEPAAEWNAFGSWLARNHLLSNQNAITDASTNELLQAQGV
jgi:ABC-type nitrate/sulfonate/bicarbonate transport system substrate-binding protein